MRIRWLAGLAAALALGTAANAQPAAEQPTVEVKLKSVNVLLDKGEYLAGLAGKSEVFKQVREIVKQLSADGKGLEGIDPAKPFAFSATLTQDVINSPVLVMVPIADEERFLKLLKERAQLAPEKADDGTFKIAVPVINELYLRFANGYVYIGRTVKSLDPKAIPAPNTVFGKDDGAVGSAVLHIDRIPDGLKQFVLGQLELGIAEQKKNANLDDNPAKKLGFDLFTENALSGIKSFVEDSKELSVRVFIDEKTDEMSGELTLTAKSGTTLAKNLANLSGKTSLPAALIGPAKDAAVRGSVKAGFPEGVKKDLAKLVDTGIDEILKDVQAEAKPIAEKALKTLAPTLKSGELDAAFALNGPDDKGRYTLIGAVGVKNGRDIEKLAKDLVAEYGGHLANEVAFDFDVAKVGSFNLHTITIKNVPPDLDRVFGTGKIWVATSDDYVALSIEPDGAALKAGLKATPAAAPVASLDIAFARVLPLAAKDVPPDELKKKLAAAFPGGDATGKDTLTVTITGGNQLTVKGKLKGGGIRLLTSLEQFKVK
jgi:hypothetical protein